MSDDDARVHWLDLLRGSRQILSESRPLPAAALQLLALRPASRESLGKTLALQARRLPDQPALLFERRSWTYAQFNAWVNRCAAVLRGLGAGPQQRVAILMENRPEVLAYVAAAAKLGAVAVMLNPQQRAPALAATVSRSQARILLLGEECADSWGQAGEALASPRPAVLFDGRRVQGRGINARRLVERASDEEPPELAAIRARDPLFHIFTSGTSGLPKASVMTHLRWLRCMQALGRMTLRLRSDDVIYCPLPLHHNNALTVTWSAALGAGCALALGRRFSASRFWDEIRRYDASAFCYIGELCRYLLQQPASAKDRKHRLRLMVGNGLRPELWEPFKTRFDVPRIVEFYGASEGNLGFANVFGIDRTAGFCPFPYAIVAVDVQSEEPLRNLRGRMTRVARGGVGLLITKVSRRAPFDGYADPAANESKLLRDVFGQGDAWFNTGDLVRDQGLRHIQFVDRLGDTFRWKGENVSTGEVERALGEYPGVQHAVVYGVEVPQAEGRAGMAALTVSEAFDLEGLLAFLQARLPRYAVPVFLRMQAAEETTTTLKYRRFTLKAQGFDSGEKGEAVFIALPQEQAYQPLVGEWLAQLADARLRL